MKKYLLCVMMLLSIAMMPARFLVASPDIQSILDKITFFGDSTTYGMIRYIVENDGRYGEHIYSLSKDQILVPPDGTFYLRNLGRLRVNVQGEPLTLPMALSKLQPEIFVITVGINGLCQWEKDDFLAYYSRLYTTCAEAAPQSRIIFQSIFPISKDRAVHLERFTNEKIDEVNLWIKEYADTIGITYLNTATVLKDNEGYLPSEYQNGDGMHLSAQGFDRILGYIGEFLGNEHKGESYE